MRQTVIGKIEKCEQFKGTDCELENHTKRAVGDLEELQRGFKNQEKQ